MCIRVHATAEQVKQSQTGPWTNQVSQVKALETLSVMSENQTDSLMEQVHALTQEAVQQQETVRTLQETVRSPEALRCTDLQRMRDVVLGLEEKGPQTCGAWLTCSRWHQKQDATLMPSQRANTANDQVPNVLMCARTAVRKAIRQETAERSREKDRKVMTARDRVKGKGAAKTFDGDRRNWKVRRQGMLGDKFNETNTKRSRKQGQEGQASKRKPVRTLTEKAKDCQTLRVR